MDLYLPLLVMHHPPPAYGYGFATVYYGSDLLVPLPQALVVFSAWFFDKDRPAFINIIWQVWKKALRGINSMWLQFITASHLKYLPPKLY